MPNSLFDHFPEAVIQISAGQIEYFNPMAAHFLPGLTVGAPVPEGLDLPVTEVSGSGTFTAALTTYTFSLSAGAGADGYTVFFRPAPQTALTEQQLSGALRQLRSFLGEFAMELGPSTAPDAPAPDKAVLADFVKSYHRAFRLLNNLEYMHRAGTPEGVTFSPAPVDLAALCRYVAAASADLLAQAGISLEFHCEVPSLLVSGDMPLLRTLLLGLISNSAQAAEKGGRIALRLRRQNGRALLTLTDSGQALSPRQLASMLQQDNDHSIPAPGQGAGLGLAVARHIVSLHRGSFLVEWGSGAPTVVIALPAGSVDPRVSVQTPRSEYDGGLDPVLVALSDVLPARLFAADGLD